MSKICAHFWFLKMGFWSEKVGLGQIWVEFGRSFWTCTDDFTQIFAHLPTFCPLLKYGFGHKFGDLAIEKPSIYAGLRVLRNQKAHLPTFFLKLL